ncbi:aldo/keto reductase [Pseudoalteromonas phenolica]|uniref:aldo/keto reductase n=1 Tax=Pseudoalteromonas phenolica TaxID=161398 RepID=UPI00148714D9|nr:aldo/keto reductase [Pseudoalteromonas phenolica]
MFLNKGLPVCFGTWGLGGENTISGTPLGWPNIDYNKSRLLLEHAYDRGIRFFDTSDFYGSGKSERLLKDAFSKNFSQVYISTKGGIKAETMKNPKALQKDFSPSYIRNQVFKSLENLGRDSIDLYMLHGPYLSDITEELLFCLDDLKRQKVIMNAGVSMRRSKFRETYQAFSQFSQFDTLQFQYNATRFEDIDFINELKCKEKMNMARSLFSHGLLLKEGGGFEFSKEDHRIDKVDEKLKEKVKCYRELLKKRLDITPLYAALYLAVRNRNVDLSVIGFTSVQQIDEAIELLALIMDKRDDCFESILEIAKEIF